jgi:CubicO group peptidase (beta-lactamase class C family)
MKTNRPISTVLISLVLASCVTAQVLAQQSLPDQIEQYVLNSHEMGDFHGAILVADDGEVIYENGLGYANYEWEIENTLNTRFRVGSITKQFTSLLIYQLMESGDLSLSDTISDHLNYYRNDTGSKVTIAALLNHRSGIPDLPDEFPEKYERNSYPIREFVEMFASGDLDTAPCERFRYSNAGYYILGAILEQITGKTYAELLQERIFDPLGMKDSFYVGDLSVILRKAYGYRRKEGTDGAIMNAALLDPSVAFSYGGIYSTVGDLYKWDRALYSNLLLTEASRQQMFTSPYGDTYSNGWINYPVEVPNEKGSFIVTMHQGSINGYSGVIYRNLETQDLVVILNNMATNGSEWKMGEELMRMLRH